MKKITLTLSMALMSIVAFAQQSLSIATVNGMPFEDFQTSINDGFSNIIFQNVDYTYVIDYTEMPLTAMVEGEEVTNNIQIKILEASFADTATIVTQDITAASGQVTLTLTPQDLLSAAIIQVRFLSTEDFGEDSTENLFFFDYIVEEPSLSVNDFAKDNISASISQKDGIVTIADSVETEDYKLYDMTGALVIEKEADGILDINGLPNGVYILATDAGLTKIGK